jgi:predicted regulator of Ras-like GTPase activity (Roadblock/LC7/MglB family)
MKMAIEGSLRDMSLPTLVQSILQEGLQARIQLKQAEMMGHLFVDGGQLRYAALWPHTGRPEVWQSGEEVVYELLGWQEGSFLIERGIPPPADDIDTTWDFLLMEGLRRLDERQPRERYSLATSLPLGEMAAMKIVIKQQEVEQNMASKGEQVQDILKEAVANSGDITGAVVVSSDGLLIASVLNGNVDGSRVGAVSAGLISLATRSAQQLSQGDLSQIVIQASGGNIIAVRAGQQASFVALTGGNANLGMAFLECRDAAKNVAAIL